MSSHAKWLGWVLTVSALLVSTVSPAAAAPVAVPAGVRMHPEGTLKLANRQLFAGSTIELGGEKFGGGSRLQIVLVGLAGRFHLGDVTADSVGGFTESFELPVDLNVGAYRLVAIATDEDEVASLNVELLAAAVDPGEEEGHAGDAGQSEGGEHAVGAEPNDEPLALDRAGSPWVTGGAIVTIVFAVVGGALLLRRPNEIA